MRMKAQSKWSWEVAAYLFLAGLGGGAYVAGVTGDFLGAGWEVPSKVGVFLGFPSVFIGCMFLIADLGSPKNFWRAAMRPGTSWIARGTIIITIFMILDAIHIGFWVWPFPGVLANVDGARHFLGILGIIFAFATMIYTGILLGAARPIAFWSTAMLPLLFLVSALSTGVMAVVLVSSILGAAHEGPIAGLTRLDVMLIILEIFVVGFYLQATHRVPESRASALLVMTGAVAPMFWLGFAFLGLLLPLVLELIGAFALTGAGAGIAAVIAAISGIVGGLILRQVVLLGGIQAPLKAGRFEFALP